MQQFLRMFLQGQNGGLPTFTSGAPGGDQRQAAMSAALGMSGPIRRNMSGDVILPGTPGTGERSKLDSATFSGLDAFHAMQRNPEASAARYKTPMFGTASGGPRGAEPAWGRLPITMDTRDSATQAQQRTLFPDERRQKQLKFTQALTRSMRRAKA